MIRLCTVLTYFAIRDGDIVTIRVSPHGSALTLSDNHPPENDSSESLPIIPHSASEDEHY